MQLLTWTGALPLLLCVYCASAELYRQSRQVSASNQPGLCRYGRRLDCCYGWQKNSEGHCEAQCERGCKHGECVGPNKCKCFPGYTGKTCNQDLNECGLKPRPCEHRCMNTHGSYMCYCLNGYMLMPDGSCANSRTCALAHCQYGCEEVQGEIRCLCPSSGLQLGVDQRTCVDIDECATRKNLCPYNRRCVNTFGSYFCKCRVGFDLKYVNGKYDCADIDECGNETHRCSQHAVCINTQGSYKCKCKSGFRGNGTECTVKPFFQKSRLGGKGGVDKGLNAIPDVPGRPPHSRLDSEQIRNTIPEAPVTTDPRVRLQPFDYDGEVYVGNHGEAEPREQLPEEEEEEAGGKKEDNQENQIKSEELPPRGDVFFPKDFKSVFGPQTEVKEIPLVPGREEFILDCDFEQGACEWVQNREDDFDWKVVRRDKGTGYYMAASAPPGNRKALGRLELQLRGQTEPGVFCLTFSFRLSGEREAALRVVLDNDSYPAWEERHGGRAGGRRGHGQAWQTEFLTVAWEEDRPQSIVFEAEQGDGAGGEVGLDGVLLNSGSCQEHQSSLF